MYNPKDYTHMIVGTVYSICDENMWSGIKRDNQNPTCPKCRAWIEKCEAGRREAQARLAAKAAK